MNYVAIDVAGFTREMRSVEAQCHVIDTMNSVVRDALARLNAEPFVVLPTGDGMFIALQGREHDDNLTLALAILRGLAVANAKQEDERRVFGLRVALSENDDNLITDYNGRANLAGAGINEAARLLECADASQIVVSRMVYTRLARREKYQKSFARFVHEMKHGERIDVFQYIGDAEGVSSEIPISFRGPDQSAQTLTDEQVAYFAVCFRERELLLEARNKRGVVVGPACAMMMWMVAQDEFAVATRTEFHEGHSPSVIGGGNLEGDALLAEYESIDQSVAQLARETIESKVGCAGCFELDELGMEMLEFPTDSAFNRAREDSPEVWEKIVGGESA